MSDDSRSGSAEASKQTLSGKESLRRQAWLLVFRLVVGTALILAAYAAMPTGGKNMNWGAIPVTILALALFTVIFARQVRAISSARRPVVRAVELLVCSLLIFMVLFAAVAVQLESFSPGSYTEPLNKVDGFYFSVTTLATVGFGDITPVTTTARVVTTIQMLGNLVLLGIAFRLLSQEVEARVRQARSSRTDSSTGSESAT
jgi:voltage-gated potassium channel